MIYFRFLNYHSCLFIGGYDKEEKAARAYDLAALKYWGTTTTTNFPVSFSFVPLFENEHVCMKSFIMQ